ncbi:MAG: hypothetical protein A4E45_02082 [Methanosaeta sp. PtaB.Bin039]|nr:MAG: hypothetical protein A4E45_02082 [Methanosaeta sp. PtaB.Bin039]
MRQLTLTDFSKSKPGRPPGGIVSFEQAISKRARQRGVLDRGGGELLRLARRCGLNHLEEIRAALRAAGWELTTNKSGLPCWRPPA